LRGNGKAKASSARPEPDGWRPGKSDVNEGIGALVGEVVTAGVAQHMGPDVAELCGFASDPHDVVDGLAGELRLALRDKEPWQVVGAGGEIALDGAELVPRAHGDANDYCMGRGNGGRG
jgi:hypothetical protein